MNHTEPNVLLATWLIFPLIVKQKSNLHCTCCIMARRVTDSGVQLHGIAPGQHSFEELSQRWLAVGDTVSDLTGPGIEP